MSAGELPGPAGRETIVVDPDRILEVARVVREQGEALESALLAHAEALRVTPPAINQIFRHVAETWNAVIVDNADSYLARAWEYRTRLHDLTEQLRRMAERYRFDEDEMAAVFGDIAVERS